MNATQVALTKQVPDVDLTACDREPIHIPGSIQPQGALVVLREPGYEIIQASENLRQFGAIDALDNALGRQLDAVVGPANAALLLKEIQHSSLDANPLYLGTIRHGSDETAVDLHAIAHRNDGVLIIELEPSGESPAQRDVSGRLTFQNLYPFVREFMSRMRCQRGVLDLCQLAAAEVRRITGYDRVLIYRFEPDDSGVVIAEDRNDVYPPFLDHRFPASDIPRQARELYERNRLRVIADVQYQPVPLVPQNNPLTGKPLDLSYASLRSVSPIHLEYLKNMGVRASLSISLLRDGKLWGLVSGHHSTARPAPFQTRIACDLLGQALGVQIEAEEHHADINHRLQLRALQTKLLTAMANESQFVEGLLREPSGLMDFMAAAGAAVIFADQFRLVGATPSEAQVRRLINWIAQRSNGDVFHSNSLSGQFAEAEQYVAVASGVLAVSISKLHQAYILWFRPEQVRTLKWAGDPTKAAEPTPQGLRMHPRKSFQIWLQTVRATSAPWMPAEIDAALELRNSVVGIVLRRAEELAALSSDLERSNRELEAFSYSVSHDLRAPFRHIAGFAALLSEHEASRLTSEGKRYLQTIQEAAHFAGTLVDNLLTFSQMGRNQLHKTDIDMNQLVAETRGMARDAKAMHPPEWIVSDLPPAHADPIMLRLVWQNLISNAIKYSRMRDKPLIEIGGTQEAERNVYWIRDNGIGFDMAYVGKLFGVFQRLHRIEEFEGAGIGLANVSRIVHRHGGTVWARGELDRGATFSFALPSHSAKEKATDGQVAPNGKCADR